MLPYLPSPMLMGGGAQGPTYAQYQAQIAALAVDGALPWATNSTKPTGKWRSTAGALGAANLWGSPWMSYFAHDSSTARMVQHGVDTQAVFDAIMAGGFEVYFEIVDIGVQPSFTSQSRNGFTSANYTEYPARRCVDMIIWDGSQALRGNPFAGTPFTSYSWVI